MQWDGSKWETENGEDEKSVRPNKLDYIITGIPRSGTSLLSAILTESENSVCFNEIHYPVQTLPLFFSEMRTRISNELPVYMKLDKNSNLTTDTQNNGGNFGTVIFNDKCDKNLRLGSKVTDPYLRRIEEILGLGYKVVFMIRNPIYSIKSWNSVNASKSPLGRVDGLNQHRRWNRFGFSDESRLLRHVKIWDYYAEIIKSNSDDCLVIKYEDLVMNVVETLDKICKYLDIKKPSEIPKLVNGNLKYKHEDILSIKEELSINSELMFDFGYQES